MSDAAVPSDRSGFSPRTMIALVLVGIFAFSGFTVLSVYAPDLRGGEDGGTHALSKSAVGFAGAAALLKARGAPVVISRSPLEHASAGLALRVLTPPLGAEPKVLAAYAKDGPLLVVLPKWNVAPDPARLGWVRKLDLDGGGARVLRDLSPSTVMYTRPGLTRPVLHGAGGPFLAGTYLPLDRIDRLQAIIGDDWRPVLVDDEGHMVLAQWRDTSLYVLSDPDFMNTQGLKGLNNARAALAILEGLHGDDGVAFDVTVNGFKRSRSVLRLLFEPPMLGATLCALAAALLMGVHAAVRFGPAAGSGRAFALGKRALIDTSADLVRAARKEHELAPAYAALIEARVARAAGERDPGVADRTERLQGLERRRRPTQSLQALTEAARAARTRGETLSVAAKLFHWRSEMTRDRR